MAKRPDESYTFKFTVHNKRGETISTYQRAYNGKSRVSWGDFANEAIGNDVLNWLSPADVETITIKLL